MTHVDIKRNENTIKLCGTKGIIEKEKLIIENLNLSGQENSDRLIIQKCIDEHKLKSTILYNGNTVYPFEKIIKSYRKLQSNGSLAQMSDDMYRFFIYACGDIAHYDINGFRNNYNYSFRNLENELLSCCTTASRFSDINRIFKELKIGREYFKDRDLIDLDSLSLCQLKTFIEECNWRVIENNSPITLLNKSFQLTKGKRI